MTYIPNDKKISAGDKINYVDHGGNTHKATMRELTNNHYAEIAHGEHIFTGVPYSVSPERHTWHHADPEPEPEEEEIEDGSTKGEQQRKGASSQSQEVRQAKESTQGKGTQTGSKTSY